MLVIYKRDDESDGDGHNDLSRTTFCRNVFVSLDGTNQNRGIMTHVASAHCSDEDAE